MKTAPCHCRHSAVLSLFKTIILFHYDAFGFAAIGAEEIDACSQTFGVEHRGISVSRDGGYSRTCEVVDLHIDFIGAGSEYFPATVAHGLYEDVVFIVAYGYIFYAGEF